MSKFLMLVYIALGMAISESYNWAKWKRYMQGMEHGVSMRTWKEGTDARPAIRMRVKTGK